MIPAELRERPQWVVWRYETRDAKRTKVPYCVKTGKRASSTDGQTWTTFETATAFAQRHADGVGFVFSEGDPFCGVDLDNCVGEAQSLHPAAAEIVKRLSSYTELSPSGAGVHVIMRAKLPTGTRNRTGKTPWGGTFEVYDRDRFFTMTGKTIELLPQLEVESRQQELERPLAELFPAPSKNGGRPAGLRSSGRTDAEVLERAFSAKNGTTLQALYRGDVSGYGSRSEADLALCSMLAFWTGPDPGQLDRLFRGSGLIRDKWGRVDYRESTLAKALDRSEYHQPAEVHSPPNAPDAPAVATGEGRGGASGGRGPRKGSPPNAPSTPVGAPGGASTRECTFALPLAEFIAERSESPPALVGDESEVILPATGFMLLFARGGKGKTTATVELALHLASGVDWLGFAVARPLRVLFVENEGPREPFRAKLELKRKLWEHEIAGELFVCTVDWGAFSLADQANASALRAFIAEHEIDLVIGDPLDSLGVDGVGSPEDTRRFMELMSRAGLFRDVAFLLLHHPRKEGAEDELDEAAGAWGGKPDTVLRLDRKEGNRARLSFPKVRWSRRGMRPAYILAFDPDSESFTVAHEEHDEERDYLAEVVELLGEGRWRTVKEIMAPKPGGIGASETVIKHVLEGNPDRFTSRTGDDARAVGRHRSATVWQLVGAANEPSQDQLEWS